MVYKSLHTIFYTFSYEDKLPLPLDRMSICEESDDIRYFSQFNSLFSKGKIEAYEINKSPGKNELISANNSVFSLLIESKQLDFDIISVKLYHLKQFKNVVIALTIVNTEYDDFILLSRHLDKNTSYSSMDEFQGITINNNFVANHSSSELFASQLLNGYFFDGKAINLKLSLGRKNFHMFSIVDERLSNLCCDLSKDTDYEIYKIATSEFVNTTVGKKTYQEFIDSMYDKWQDTGSLYFVNFTNFVQILPDDGFDHSEYFMKSYQKMVILSLMQKANFINFQTIAQKRNELKNFNKFINQCYYLEISPERQLDTLYDMLQSALKNLDYYKMLKSETEIYASSMNNRMMFIVTSIYTFFAIVSVLLMLWGMR